MDLQRNRRRVASDLSLQSSRSLFPSLERTEGSKSKGPVPIRIQARKLKINSETLNEKPEISSRRNAILVRKMGQTSAKIEYIDEDDLASKFPINKIISYPQGLLETKREEKLQSTFVSFRSHIMSNIESHSEFDPISNGNTVVIRRILKNNREKAQEISGMVSQHKGVLMELTSKRGFWSKKHSTSLIRVVHSKSRSVNLFDNDHLSLENFGQGQQEQMEEENKNVEFIYSPNQNIRFYCFFQNPIKSTYLPDAKECVSMVSFRDKAYPFGGLRSDSTSIQLVLDLSKTKGMPLNGSSLVT